MSIPGEVAGGLRVRGRRRGRPGGAEELFHDVYPRLAGWVRQQVGDDGTAHEIASEAFVRLLSRWTAVEDPQRYLYRTAASLIRQAGPAPHRACPASGRTAAKPRA